MQDCSGSNLMCCWLKKYTAGNLMGVPFSCCASNLRACLSLLIRCCFLSCLFASALSVTVWLFSSSRCGPAYSWRSTWLTDLFSVRLGFILWPNGWQISELLHSPNHKSRKSLFPNPLVVSFNICPPGMSPSWAASQANKFSAQLSWSISGYSG